MENNSGKCVRCKNLDLYYTKGVKKIFQDEIRVVHCKMCDGKDGRRLRKLLPDKKKVQNKSDDKVQH